eukprot:4743332-Prymnesium_polylepis.1
MPSARTPPHCASVSRCTPSEVRQRDSVGRTPHAASAPVATPVCRRGMTRAVAAPPLTPRRPSPA